MRCPTCKKRWNLLEEAFLIPHPEHGGFDAYCPNDNAHLAWMMPFRPDPNHNVEA